MGLDWEICLPVKSAESREEWSGAGGCEARRQDGGDEGVCRIEAGDVRDGCAGRGDGFFRGGILVVGWVEVRIHVATADESSLAMGEADGSEERGRASRGCGKVGCCRCAVAEGAGYAVSVDCGCFGERRERRFEWESVFLEPGEERGLAEDTGIRIL